MPLSDLEIIDQWLYGRSLATQDYYRRYALQFLENAGKGLKAANLSDLQRFASDLQQRGLAASSQRTAIAAVKSLLSFACKAGHLQSNAAQLLHPPKVRETLSERILGEAEVAAAIRLELDEQARLVLKMLYFSGFRSSELCGLRWKDLRPSGDAGTATVFGKGGKTRSVLLPNAFWLELQAARQSDESPFFAGTRFDLYKLVKRAFERAGCKASPHYLRHAHASHSLDHNAPIHLVQQTLGHASIATTGRYLHAKPSDSSSRYLNL